MDAIIDITKRISEGDLNDELSSEIKPILKEIQEILDRQKKIETANMSLIHLIRTICQSYINGTLTLNEVNDLLQVYDINYNDTKRRMD